MKKTFKLLCFALSFCFIPLIQSQWNNPHTVDAAKNILYSSFNESPKTLDPARSYSENEAIFIAQIYEPPLQYHYLKRPYALVPLTATSLPKITYYNREGKILTDANHFEKDVAYSTYDIYIKPGIFYQPHPAFAKDQQGNYLYHHLTPRDLKNIHVLQDFKHTGTRELTAYDYEYEIKRLAEPTVNSPILGLMGKYIVGLSDYANQLQKSYQQFTLEKPQNSFFDLRKYPIAGVKVFDRYHYQIKIMGAYPQFQYWLAMPFFAPIPWEADLFYSQPGMADRTLTFNWYPVGTGPYMLVENNPNRKMVLQRNPNFHGEIFPSAGEITDMKMGYLNDAGRPIPFLDEVDFDLEKESIPRWSKFLQGYYDRSAISSDSFDQAIKIDSNGNPQLTDSMKSKGIKLQTAVAPSLFYLGFNMLDDVVGGNSEKNRKLRQAISIALDDQEYISIFLNGRGIPAQGPIPPGIFGYEEKNFNPVVYEQRNGKIQRKSIAEAKKLLAEAGYPHGINPKTGQPLILNYDVATTGGPDEQSRLDWYRKQFAKLGIKLNIRATDYNRFQEKVRVGNAQLYSWGWNADYPDPENFLFLLYGPNGKVKYGGENATNYENRKFDALFEQIRDLPNGKERQEKINEALKILREDSPWAWGFNPISFTLSHIWTSSAKPIPVANNTLKYQKIDPQLRKKLQEAWNLPILWPLAIIFGFIILMCIPLVLIYRRREKNPNVRRI